MAVWAAVFLVYGAILLVQGDGIGWVVVIGALVMLAGIVLTARDGGRHRAAQSAAPPHPPPPVARTDFRRRGLGAGTGPAGSRTAGPCSRARPAGAGADHTHSTGVPGQRT